MVLKYRVLERSKEGHWELFAVAFRCENRVWLFTPAWRAPQPLPIFDLAQLSSEHFPADGALYRWGQDLRAARGDVYHPIQLIREAMVPQPDALRSELPRALQELEILPGQESGSLLYAVRGEVFDENLNSLGNAMRLVVSYLKSHRDCRPKFRTLINTIISPANGLQWAVNLVLLANRFEFPTWAVQCLPNLCFRLPTNNQDEGTIFVLWQQIAIAIPLSYTLEIKEKLCGGEVLVAGFDRPGARLVERIAGWVEPERLSNPFASDRSARGALAQAFDSIRLEDAEIAGPAEEAQKKVLTDLGVGFAAGPR